MQVANALNNNIRILFNPNVEAFKLFDFLMVKSATDRYLAQVIEIYDDKFDASQNVAKLKLFYKITHNNEVMPYDNFTPNKECEIIKLKQEEIEDFINQDKDTFIFATNVKSQTGLKLQYDFFNNNAVVLSDKIENSNVISLNLAKKLSSVKNSIIVDSTGIVDFEEAVKIKATRDFRLPLNDITIDYVFDKCLSDASLEFQATCGAIINEIKKFAKKQPLGFIPFNAFARVLIQQYKATPYAELKLLLVRLKKCQMSEIFARSKRDYENLFNTIKNNKITIVDLSGLDLFWQKIYFEYLIHDLSQEVYLISRVNDENCDTDLINKIYNKKPNIKFIPTVSYNYKKLPSILQNCKNYILMPSLYQRSDFLDANFALSNLIPDGCVLFGENTDNFLYYAKDYELTVQEKRKNYRKIALSLFDDENEKINEKDYYSSNDNKNNKSTDSERLIKELNNFEQQQNQEMNKEVDENFDKAINEEEEDFLNQNVNKISYKESEDVFETPQSSISEEKIDSAFEDEVQENEVQEDEEESQTSSIQEEAEETESVSEISKENSTDDFSHFEETQNEPENEHQEEIKEVEEVIEPEIVETPSEEKSPFQEILDEEDDEIEDNSKIENQASDENIEEIIEEEKEELLDKDFQTEPLIEKEAPSKENQEVEEVEEIEEIKEAVEIKEEPAREVKKEREIDFSKVDLIDPEDENYVPPVQNISSPYDYVEKENKNDVELQEMGDAYDTGLSDDELDFFEIAKESSLGFENEEEHQNQNDELDLSTLADNSIDNSFNQIIESKPQTVSNDNDDEVNLEKIENSQPKEKLPIFKNEEQESDEEVQYNVGDVIFHKKYGKGSIVKIINYEERQLLQIEFENSGKKLLDPKVADIQLEQ